MMIRSPFRETEKLPQFVPVFRDVFHELCDGYTHDSVTIQRVIAADCVYIYGLYGIPQSLGEHELEGGLQPHWAHLDVLTEGFRSKRDEKIIAILEYQ